MSDPTSAVGCVVAVYAVLGVLFLHLAFAVALFVCIPVLGLILAFVIWQQDRPSALCLLVASGLALAFASYVAGQAKETSLAWINYTPMLIGAYSALIALELVVHLVRSRSHLPAHRKAGKSALKIALLSIVAGLLLAYLTGP